MTDILKTAAMFISFSGAAAAAGAGALFVFSAVVAPAIGLPGGPAEIAIFGF